MKISRKNGSVMQLYEVFQGVSWNLVARRQLTQVQVSSKVGDLVGFNGMQLARLVYNSFNFWVCSRCMEVADGYMQCFFQITYEKYLTEMELLEMLSWLKHEMLIG